MKTLVSVYAGSPKNYAFEPVFNGQSAFARVVEWINYLSTQPEIQLHGGVIFTVPEYKEVMEEATKHCQVPITVLAGDFTSVSAFLAALDSHKGDCTTIIHGRYSCPFYDGQLSKELFNFHHKYAAEYTFASSRVLPRKKTLILLFVARTRFSSSLTNAYKISKVFLSPFSLWNSSMAILYQPL